MKKLLFGLGIAALTIGGASITTSCGEAKAEETAEHKCCDKEDCTCKGEECSKDCKAKCDKKECSHDGKCDGKSCDGKKCSHDKKECSHEGKECSHDKKSCSHHKAEETETAE